MALPARTLAASHHRQHRVAPGHTKAVTQHELLVDLPQGGLYGEHPSLGHDVSGIGGQIHQDLLDLARIGKDQCSIFDLTA